MLSSANSCTHPAAITQDLRSAPPPQRSRYCWGWLVLPLCISLWGPGRPAAHGWASCPVRGGCWWQGQGLYHKMSLTVGPLTAGQWIWKPDSLTASKRRRATGWGVTKQKKTKERFLWNWRIISYLTWRFLLSERRAVFLPLEKLEFCR